MNTECYENRELSWLKFNARVLEQAEDHTIPLCERMNFLSIFQSNLDEFVMVRIGSLHDEMLVAPSNRENKTNMRPKEQIAAAMGEIRGLNRRASAAYGGIMERLADCGVSLADFSRIGDESRVKLEELFLREYVPLLSTIVVGKKQAFPFLKNKDIYAVAVLTSKSGKKKIGIVPCAGDVFSRLVPIPGDSGSYILSEELILHFMPFLFPGYRITSKALARITRNADIDADSIYDEDLNYRDSMEKLVKSRKKLAPVRLELSREIDNEIVNALCGHLKLDGEQVMENCCPLEYSFLSELQDKLRAKTELFYPPRHPQPALDFDESSSIIGQIAQRDRLLHFPYETVRPFLSLLEEAAKDPQVVTIKMTLYRLASHSKIIDSLVEAVENGKQVDVLVELKARFDEEKNIEWSRRLERAGCHVIYGLDGYKVHSKLCQIIRKTDDGVQYITQIGTGNYNEKTNRLYTDLSLFTASPAIGVEVSEIFRALSMGGTVEKTKQLLVAPNCLQNKLVDLIDGEIVKGERGYIGIKINSLTDKVLIDKLIEAGKAGVKVDMVIRGICCLRSAVEGETDNITVVSIVGRYLEHSRIYLFGTGRRAKCYIGSADWMTRSTLRRVEVAVPVTDGEIKARIQNIFSTMLRDNVNARVRRSDGSYARREVVGERVDCQETFYIPRTEKGQ